MQTFVKHCIGGPSGLARPTTTQCNLMHTPGNTPRHSKCCIWMRLKADPCEWLIYVINTTEGVPKEVVHCNPIEGGNFVMKNLTLSEYKFFHYLVMTKNLCAKVLTHLSAALESKTLPHKINPMAVAVAVALDMINMINICAIIKGNPEKENVSTFYTQYSHHCMNFTLVMHPMGIHLDMCL